MEAPTPGSSLSTLETVVVETPASFAICAIVERFTWFFSKAVLLLTLN